MIKAIDSQTLQQLTPLSSEIEQTLQEASKHALSTEGSFTRARLTQTLSLSLGLDQSIAEKLGAAVELFHLASLLLDDLPCMDNAEQRRSRACTHTLYGESTTLLTVVGLINQAYCLLWQVFSQSKPDIQEEAARLTQECLGFTGILDGQAKDLNYFFPSNDIRQITEIAEKKTGSLLRLCLLLPAVISETSRYEKWQLVSLARTWGLAYQVTDDLKDLFCGEPVSGKSPQRDATLGRPNMALALGEKQAADFLKSLLDKSKSIAESLHASFPVKFAILHDFQSRLEAKVDVLLRGIEAA